MAKLEILTSDERKAFDVPPILTPAEREKVFQLPDEILTWIQTFDFTINQVGFVLLWGYCKHTGRFFLPKTFHVEDIIDVARRLKVDVTQTEFKKYKEKTAHNHKQAIRNYLQLMPFNEAIQSVFLEAISERVAKHQQPKQILIEVAALLRAKHIEVPSYNRFALVITETITHFEKEVLTALIEQLTPAQCKTLDELLIIDPETNLSKLTQLKSISHSRKPMAIRKSVIQFRATQILYDSHASLMQTLSLHNETIKHYANWIRKASLQQIRQLAEPKRYLHLLAFIANQYRLRQDISADMLLVCVQSTENAILKEQKNRSFQNANVQHQTIQLLTEARISYKSLLNKIQTIAKATVFSDAEKMQQINELLDRYQTQYPQEPQIDVLQKETLENIRIQNYYILLENFSIKLQNRVAEIIKYLSFDATTMQPDLLIAIQHYQAKLGVIGKDAPQDFLNATETNVLLDESGKFRVSLYKALLFLHVANALKSGVLSLIPACRYLTLDAYLYSVPRWQQQKENILEQAGLTHFYSFSEVTNQLEKMLNAQYHKTNQRIKTGKNAYIKFDRKNKMVLTTPKVEKINTQSVSALFVDCKQVSILQILSDVNRVTDYLSCFRHHSVKDKKILPRKEAFYAAILGQGCNLGPSKMSSVSKGVSENVLTNLINWHFNLDNIHAANNKILELIQKLSLSAIYQKNPVALHTSSDGRKTGIAVDSLNANYSFKYHGNGIGVSIYSFIDERNRVFYSTVISSSEREAAYVIDGLLHNLAIKSTIHSTDTHGYSETVFGVMHLMDIFFAPRIKKLKKSTLYSFESKKIYEANGYKILPERYIDKQLIETHWDDILRLMATIKLKETTASLIFKRLSSYSKQHPLYCALKEFGRIIKSLFILRYIDEVELRQAIEKQLNRVELSNKFSKAILFGNNQEIQYSGKEEQELVVSCQRFIQNAIILWNELYLSQRLAIQEDPEQRKKMLMIISNGSTMIWQHINLHGEYDFTQDVAANDLQFDMDKILALKVA